MTDGTGDKTRPPYSLLWMAALSAYWFATSYKWFLILVFLLPAQVAEIVPGGEKSAYWGVIFGLGAIWAIIGPALFGDMSDRKGDRRPFIMAGSLLTLVALALLHSGNTILALTIGYLALQVSDDIATGPYSALVPELVPKDFRGRASGVMGLAMSLSQVAAVGVALLAGEHRAVLYLSIAALNVMGAVIVVRLIGPCRWKPAPRASFLAGWLKPWKQPDFRFVWMTRFLGTLSFYFIIPYVNFYVRDVLPPFDLFGFTLRSASEATGVLALTMALCGAAGSFAAGYLSDLWGRKRVTYCGAALMVLPLLAMALLPSLSVIVLLSVLMGAGYGAFQTANWAMVSDVLPDPEGTGRDMGIWQMSISSVQVIAGAAGFIVALGNRLDENLGYRILFVFAAVSIAAGGLVARRVKESQ